MPVNTPGPIPKAAIDYLRSKRLKPSFDYRDTWREQHAYSFTVAKAMQHGMLQDIKQALDDALANGTTFEQFKQELTPTLQAKGWWGVRQAVDPTTGEIIDAQLGSPRRLKIIYDANLRTAQAAGQWDRIQRTKTALPYLVYELGPSVEHRQDHVAWAGIILPVDHVFWKTHFAPNGYGCKCRIRQISKVEAERLLKQGGYTNTAPKPEYVDWLNKRTGIIEQVPKGIDPGWDSNPGWLRQASLDADFLRKAKESGNLKFAKDIILSPLRYNEYKRWITKAYETKTRMNEIRTIGILGAQQLEVLAGLDVILKETLIVLNGNLAASFGKGKRHKIKGDALTLNQWLGVPKFIERAEHIRWVESSGQLIWYIRSGKRWVKLVARTDFKNKKAVKEGLAERLININSAYTVKDEDMAAELGRHIKIK